MRFNKNTASKVLQCINAAGVDFAMNYERFKFARGFFCIHSNSTIQFIVIYSYAFAGAKRKTMCADVCNAVVYFLLFVEAETNQDNGFKMCLVAFESNSITSYYFYLYNFIFHYYHSWAMLEFNILLNEKKQHTHKPDCELRVLKWRMFPNVDLPV